MEPRSIDSWAFDSLERNRCEPDLAGVAEKSEQVNNSLVLKWGERRKKYFRVKSNQLFERVENPKTSVVELY